MSLLNINSKQYTKLLNLHTFPTRRSSDLRSTGRINNKRNGNVQPRLFFPKTNESIKQKGEEMKEKIVKKNGIRLLDRKSTRLNSSHVAISYAVFCLKKKKKKKIV